MGALVWLVVFIVLLVIEAVTLGLTTIWFAGGALAAFVSTYLGANIWVQTGIFLLVSFVLLYLTRPAAVRYLKNKRVKTNYEGLVGKVVKVSEAVDNYNQTGTAMVNGVEWTVRSNEDKIIIKPETRVRIVNIIGVKLIVEEYKEEN